MKIEIYESQEEEQVVRVKLKKLPKDGLRFPGAIALVAVNSAGRVLSQGNLLYLGPSGIHLCTCVLPSLGFPLDEYGCIKLDEG